VIDAISIIVCLFAVIVVTAVDALVVAVIVVVINDYSIAGFDPVRSSTQTFVSTTNN